MGSSIGVNFNLERPAVCDALYKLSNAKVVALIASEMDHRMLRSFFCPYVYRTGRRASPFREAFLLWKVEPETVRSVTNRIGRASTYVELSSRCTHRERLEMNIIVSDRPPGHGFAQQLCGCK